MCIHEEKTRYNAFQRFLRYERYMTPKEATPFVDGQGPPEYRDQGLHMRSWYSQYSGTIRAVVSKSP